LVANLPYGAATPLTWSIAQNFAEKGFREAFGALGCKVPKGETLVAKFGEASSPLYTGGDGVQDRVEKRKTPAGVLECKVYRVKLDGKDAQIWVAVKYPGLVVRISIGENGKEGGSELCEFKE
jgi:hypothetical protein